MSAKPHFQWHQALRHIRGELSPERDDLDGPYGGVIVRMLITGKLGIHFKLIFPLIFRRPASKNNVLPIPACQLRYMLRIRIDKAAILAYFTSHAEIIFCLTPIIEDGCFRCEVGPGFNGHRLGELCLHGNIMVQRHPDFIRADIKFGAAVCVAIDGAALAVDIRAGCIGTGAGINAR